MTRTLDILPLLERLSGFRMRKVFAAFILFCAGTSFVGAADVSSIPNFRAYTESFASAGQPDEPQLEALAEAGFERVIYIAFTTNDGALANEDRVVRKLGMSYFHIPVEFNAPTAEDFNAFTAVMHSASKKTLLHCQVNYRATAFSFLYRVLNEGVPIAEAKEAIDSVWKPTTVWFEFMRDVLASHGRDIQCEGCNWALSDQE